MRTEQIENAVVVDGKTYIEQDDGTLVPAKSRTNWERLEAMTDKDVENSIASDPDVAPLLEEEWFQRAELYNQTEKVNLNMRVDMRVADWFKAQGKGYQARINAVLRAYVDTRPVK